MTAAQHSCMLGDAVLEGGKKKRAIVANKKLS